MYSSLEEKIFIIKMNIYETKTIIEKSLNEAGCNMI